MSDRVDDMIQFAGCVAAYLGDPTNPATQAELSLRLARVLGRSTVHWRLEMKKGGPGWHDAPPVPGVYFRTDGTAGYIQSVLAGEEGREWAGGGRWFGPIPAAPRGDDDGD